MMPRHIRGPLVLTVALMAVVVVGLVVAGLFVRSIVASSFNNDESVRVARILVADVLRRSTKRPAFVGMERIGIGFCCSRTTKDGSGCLERVAASPGCSNACAWRTRWRSFKTPP